MAPSRTTTPKCAKCEPCLTSACGECFFCLNKKSKQKCVQRVCVSDPRRDYWFRLNTKHLLRLNDANNSEKEKDLIPQASKFVKVKDPRPSAYTPGPKSKRARFNSEDANSSSTSVQVNRKRKQLFVRLTKLSIEVIQQECAGSTLRKDQHGPLSDLSKDNSDLMDLDPVEHASAYAPIAEEEENAALLVIPAVTTTSSGESNQQSLKVNATNARASLVEEEANASLLAVSAVTTTATVNAASTSIIEKEANAPLLVIPPGAASLPVKSNQLSPEVGSMVEEEANESSLNLPAGAMGIVEEEPASTITLTNMRDLDDEDVVVLNVVSAVPMSKVISLEKCSKRLNNFDADARFRVALIILAQYKIATLNREIASYEGLGGIAGARERWVSEGILREGYKTSVKEIIEELAQNKYGGLSLQLRAQLAAVLSSAAAADLKMNEPSQ